MTLLFQCLEGAFPLPGSVSSSGGLGERTGDAGFQDRQSSFLVGEATVSNSSVMSPQEMNSCLYTGILIQGSLSYHHLLLFPVSSPAFRLLLPPDLACLSQPLLNSLPVAH